jgi:hypothetical protein
VGDLIFVVVTVVFFALAVAYVKGCERIVGPDTGDLPDGAEEEASGAFRSILGRAQ